MLNLMEELLLLAIDDEKGKIISSSSTALPYGLTGTILLELSIAEKIKVDGKKLFVSDNSSTGNEILDEALYHLENITKQKSVKYWVTRLNSKMKGLKTDILSQLIKKGILTETETRILWVIPTKKYPTKNAEPENKIRKRVKDIVLNGKPRDERSILLISLINSCRLINEVFSKDERKIAKKTIKDIVKNEKIGKAVSDTVNEAVMAAVTAAVVASVASN